MSGWHYHRGKATCLLRENIDTDQIIPARFMSQPRADGYQDFLFYDIRRDDDGTIEPGFSLNRDKNVSVLVTGNNFGNGSSREAAVYALVDSGIQVVVANSFGDIFSANAINNGLLPARVNSHDIKVLAAFIEGNPHKEPMDCEVSLEEQTLVLANTTVSFDIDPVWLTKLINGWDDIDLTQTHRQAINRFRLQRHANARWAWPQSK